MLLILTDNLDNRLRFSHCLGVLCSVCGDRSSLFISRQCQSKKSKKERWTRVSSSKFMTNYIAKLDMVINHLNISHSNMCDYILYCWVCKYQLDKSKIKKKCKRTINISVDIFQIMKTMFTVTDVPFNDLLSKCLHGPKRNTS